MHLMQTKVLILGAKIHQQQCFHSLGGTTLHTCNTEPCPLLNYIPSSMVDDKNNKLGLQFHYDASSELLVAGHLMLEIDPNAFSEN